VVRLIDLVACGKESGVVVMGAQFSIEPNGEVFPCKAGSGHFGNIDKGRALLSTRWKSRSATRIAQSQSS
jgi:radical SAM protein with 4Fe4S-binding SPASM domain